MKKLVYLMIVVALAIFVATPAFAGNGNKLPPGPRYMLNVIAYDNCPNGDFTNSNRHMIAVQASYQNDPRGQTWAAVSKTNTILLTASPQEDTFQVIDGNACNKGGAEFMLPANPFDCDCGTEGLPPCDYDSPESCTGENVYFQEYLVFVRLVGKPNTGINVTTCAVDPALDPDAIVCSTENVVKVRMTGKGKMVFDEVTRELTTLCLDTDANGTCDKRVGIFDADYYNYFWQWNTTGKAHAQLVFYPIPD